MEAAIQRSSQPLQRALDVLLVPGLVVRPTGSDTVCGESAVDASRWRAALFERGRHRVYRRAARGEDRPGLLARTVPLPRPGTGRRRRPADLGVAVDADNVVLLWNETRPCAAAARTAARHRAKRCRLPDALPGVGRAQRAEWRIGTARPRLHRDCAQPGERGTPRRPGPVNVLRLGPRGAADRVF